MKKRLCLLISFVLIIMAFASCTGKNTTEISLYFKDKAENKINKETRKIHSPDKGGAEDLAKATLNELIKGPENETNKAVFSKNTKLLSLAINEKVVTVDFSEHYSEAQNVDALLLRYSVISTLCDIDGIDGVVIKVEGKPIVSEATGKEFGVLSMSDIAINTDEPAQLEKKIIYLYFPEKNGEKLITEMRSVEMQNVLSLEKTVISELLKGPENSDCTSAVPDGTKLISIETKDRVCFVNFSNEFVTKSSPSSLNTTLTLYAVVNSLCSLQNVDSVQILVDGENGVEFGNFVLDIPYKTNTDIIN